MAGEYREGTRSGEGRWDGREKLASRAGFSPCPIGRGRRADCPEITTAGPASAAMILRSGPSLLENFNTKKKMGCEAALRNLEPQNTCIS